MSLTTRKAKLYQRMRNESRRVNAKYRNLIKQVENECEKHEFGEWATEHNARTNSPMSNFLGEPFLYRTCKHCSKKESKIERSSS